MAAAHISPEWEQTVADMISRAETDMARWADTPPVALAPPAE
jgi:hypothetical protein